MTFMSWLGHGRLATLSRVRVVANDATLGIVTALLLTMNGTTLFAAAPATATAAVFAQTSTYVARVAFINSFNNAVFVRREPQWPATETESAGAHFFRATAFAARGIAAGGFNVYHVFGDLDAARRSLITLFTA